MEKMITLLFLLISYCQGQYIQTQGKNLIYKHGSKFLVFDIKGINLGNWLNQEGYMFQFQDMSQTQIRNGFKELVGPFTYNTFYQQWLDNYITQDDIKEIKKLGFNTIRLPLSMHLFFVEEYPDIFLQRGFDILDKVVNWISQEGMYTVIDMHSAPGGQEGLQIDDSYGYPFLFIEQEAQDMAIKLWQKIASIYKNNTKILGYELLNEPINNNHDELKALNQYLEPFYKNVVSKIREIDSNHIIFLGGSQCNGNFSIFGQPFDKNLVYVFHFYWTEPVVQNIQQYLDYGNKYNVPVLMGEAGENSNEWCKKTRLLLEQYHVGWMFWKYKTMENTGNAIVYFKKPNNWDLIKSFMINPRDTYNKIYEARPNFTTTLKALADLVQNINYRFCTLDYGFIDALFSFNSAQLQQQEETLNQINQI